MEALEKLVDRLKERQGDRGQNEYAAWLGISKGMLSRLYNRDRNVGMDTLVQIAQKYPDLACLFLAEAVESRPHAGGQNTTPDGSQAAVDDL